MDTVLLEQALEDLDSSLRILALGCVLCDVG